MAQIHSCFYFKIVSSIFCFDFNDVKEYCSSSAEYIVAFKGYYRQEARERFIEAALNDSDVVRWEVMPRNNPASDYPSDFDVVQVSCQALRIDCVIHIEKAIIWGILEVLVILFCH